MAADSVWKVCSICKNPIGFQQTYYRCSVSTCQRPRTGLYFCSPPCFDAHLPMMRHRESWAEQETAPTREQAAAQQSAERQLETQANPAAGGERRRIAAPGPAAEREPAEVLVVASKLKKFVRNRSGMNTSDGVMSVLSDHLREVAVEALRAAATDGRKTVLERDAHAAIRSIKGLPPAKD